MNDRNLALNCKADLEHKMKTFVKIPSEVIKDLMVIHGLNVSPRVYIDKNQIPRNFGPQGPIPLRFRVARRRDPLNLGPDRPG